MDNSDKYIKQIENAIEYAAETGSFDKRNIIENADNVCVFGLGKYFNEAFVQQNIKERFHVNLLCDNNPEKWGKEYFGLKCVSPDELKAYSNVAVILMVGEPKKLEKQLDDLGIAHVYHANLMIDTTNDLPVSKEYFSAQKSKILKAYHLLEDEESKRLYANLLCLRIAPSFSEFAYEELCTEDQYFRRDLFALGEEESFADCGAYDGDTIKGFLNTVNGKFKNIYAFELDSGNYKTLIDSIAALDAGTAEKIHCFNAGVWNEDTEMDYGKESEYDPLDGISLLKKSCSAKAKVVRLDTALQSKPVSLIKIDVEGAEKPALQGGQGIIRGQRPKLAICIYHMWDDLWEIPLYIKELVPEYKLKIRHHTETVSETVCYAYMEEKHDGQ